MTINQLYDTWFPLVRQLWGKERITLLRLITWMLVGIYRSRSVQLHRIANQIPSEAQLLSVIRRVSRGLDHSHLRVRPTYAPVAQAWLQAAAQTCGEIRLIVDGTKVSTHHQLLLVALAYRRRAVPLMWTWIPHAQGHSTSARQKSLLTAVRHLLPAGVPVLLVGDTEFGTIATVRLLEGWGWRYVLRQKGTTRLRLTGQTYWMPFRLLPARWGQAAWALGACLTKRYAQRTNLVAYWQAGAPDPWLLATNLPQAGAALRAYRRRMWIEELFGDLKGHGFDLESTHLRHVQRLSRLTFLVMLLYVWLLGVGVRAIRDGQRHWVDRHDRRDLSLFQIGLRLSERWLTNQRPFTVRLKPCLR